MAFDSDVVARADQYAGHALEERQAFATELRLARVEQDLAVHAEAHGPLVDDHLDVLAQFGQRQRSSHGFAFRRRAPGCGWGRGRVDGDVVDWYRGRSWRIRGSDLGR